MGLKKRLIIVAVAAWVCIIWSSLSSGLGPFITQLKTDPISLEAVTIDQVDKNVAVSGECYLVYDLIGYAYTEKTQTITREKSTTTDNYYWVVDCGKDLMLVKTRANDDIAAAMEDMVEAYWDSETWEDYADNFTCAAYLDGVFINNDPDMVNYYNEWISDMGETDPSWKEISLAPYTLDCTRTLSSRITMFYVGTAMLLVTIIGLIIAVAAIAKSSKKPKLQTAGAVGSSFGTYNSGAVNGADPYDTFKSSSYGTQNGGTYQSQSGSTYGTQNGGTYQSQSGSTYGTQNGSTYQSQSGSTYGTQNGGTYQSQGGSTYGTQSGGTFQSQSGSTYGTQNGGTYQSQSGSTYGTQNGGTYQSQGNSAYGTQNGGTYQSQGGSTYGTQSGGTYQSQGNSAYGTQNGSPYQSQGFINYGSTMGDVSPQSSINYGSTVYGNSYNPNE